MLSEELKYPSNFTPEVQNATAELYKGVEKVIPAVEWPFHAPLIHEINKLKIMLKRYFFITVLYTKFTKKKSDFLVMFNA